jgi:ADP-heptose:LPS heptosyltransferase
MDFKDNRTPDGVFSPLVKRVLIYRLGSLGDMTIALPCFHLIARLFPDAERCLLTNIPTHAKAPAASAILGGAGLVDDFINYPIGTRNLGEIIQTWRKIRKFAPDILIYLAAPRGEKAIKRDEFFFRLCGISKIVGLPYGELGKLAFDAGAQQWERESGRLARSLVALGDANVNELANWNLKFTAEELAVATQVVLPLDGQPIIACGVGTKMQAKDWEETNWKALFDRLAIRFPDHGVALVGAGDDSSISENISDSWNGRKVNLCGILTPRETAAVVAKAELFLGPDSGPMHLAAAVGTPCAIVFSARGKPGVWFPIGMQHEIVYHKTDCFGCNLEICVVERKRCILSIDVDEMEKAALSAWERGKRARQSLDLLAP